MYLWKIPNENSVKFLRKKKDLTEFQCILGCKNNIHQIIMENFTIFHVYFEKLLKLDQRAFSIWWN